MKVWKMLACLLSLCVIILVCAVLGGMEGEAQAPEEPPAEEGNAPTDAGLNVPAAPTLPVYSEGLSFRSNGDGTCAVSGIGTCSSSCVLIPPTSPTGDTVTEILPYAFRDSIVTAIEVPESVTVLNATSFYGCPRLACVRVAAQNTAFLESDGVLYSRDGSVLIYCPAGRTASDIVLHNGLRRVAAGAFAECVGLGNIVFQGSTSAWQSVIVGDDNAPLYAAGFRFTA
jgi:hypothetical protein